MDRVTELPMREVALDYAEEARRWKHAAGELTSLIHIGHRLTADQVSFSQCGYHRCVAARKILSKVIRVSGGTGP